MKDFIVCFAGGPLNGTAEEHDAVAPTVVRRCQTATGTWEKHVYVYDESFRFENGRHVLVARYKGKQ